jgi:hypothetical protein
MAANFFHFSEPVFPQHQTKNKPEITRKGVFPLINTPNTGFRKFRNESIPSCEKIFSTRKSNQNKPVLTRFSLAARYTSAVAKYPQPISPSIPHQPVVSHPESSEVPLRKTIPVPAGPQNPILLNPKLPYEGHCDTCSILKILRCTSVLPTNSY